MESIDDKTNITTILEIQGIKCSTRCFQIELELKQMMVMNPDDLFQKCIIKGSGSRPFIKPASSYSVEPAPIAMSNDVEMPVNIETNTGIESLNEADIIVDTNPVNEVDTTEQINETVIDNHLEQTEPEEPVIKKDPNEIEEVEFNLEELDGADEIKIKNATMFIMKCIAKLVERPKLPVI